MRVAICAITFRRPEGLERLLVGLGELTFRAEPPIIEIIIVDNDPAGPAREVCDRLAPTIKWPVRCVVEERRGIPFARNRAVAEAGEHADFIAFIDDDEVPERSWLDHLIETQRLFNAEVVAGLVLRRFEKDVPKWVIRGRMFDGLRYRTGDRIPVAFTGNLLVRRNVLVEMGRPFDERMAIRGGSDRHCLMRVHRAGYMMVWADEARVVETVPTSRTSAAWILRRNYRFGTTLSYCGLDINPSLATVVGLGCRGAVAILAGAILLPYGLVVGRHKSVRHLRYICYGAGILAGLFGSRVDEYQSIHGT